jgi:GT2 family glycosyltransferase
VIPVHNRAALTKQCLDALFAEAPDVSFETIVVDDASSDSTATLLRQYGDAIQIVSRSENGGFATACNDGARRAASENVVFLNNDTIPTSGWLDALVRYADGHEAAAVVGGRLLFPNDTIQHAGVVICQDRLPRHIYVGFPAEHPAVTKSRRFQVVTAACALVRRAAFEQVNGFDTAFRNSLEDADLCLRLAGHGHEVHYCHEAVLYHLESASRGKRSNETEQNIRLFREKWAERIRPDDLDYYRADGLLQIDYPDTYPLRIDVSPQVATVASDGRAEESERLLDTSSRQVMGLLKETVRLTAQIADLELAEGRTGEARAPRRRRARTDQVAGQVQSRHRDLQDRARKLELEILDLQEDLAGALEQNGAAEDDRTRFRPGDYLRYRRLLGRIRKLARSKLPPDATILVVSKGDDELLDLGVDRVWHFPQDAQGRYAGHYPDSSASAIAELERLRGAGAQYLVIPAMSRWWLDHYPDFAQHLRAEHELVVDDHEVCSIFALAPPDKPAR